VARRNDKVDWREGKPIFILLAALFGCSLLTGLLVIALSPRQAGLARTAQCLDNLHSLSVAVKAYAEDNANLLPPVSKPTPLADVRRGAVTYPPDAVKLWPAHDWRRGITPYVSNPAQFLCPLTQSAFSYDLNSAPEGVDTVLIIDKPNYALLWDVGLREQPGAGPHGGKYAVKTLSGTGFATSGRGELFQRLIFRP